MSTTSAPRSGWLVVMPDGLRYTWYARSMYASAKAAWAVFEPDAAKRAALRAQGWTVKAGDAVELLPCGVSVHRASA